MQIIYKSQEQESIALGLVCAGIPIRFPTGEEIYIRVSIYRKIVDPKEVMIVNLRNGYGYIYPSSKEVIVVSAEVHVKEE